MFFYIIFTRVKGGLKMIGKIIYISNNMAHIQPNGKVSNNLMNMHVIFEDKDKKILGEIEDISPELIKVNFLGEPVLLVVLSENLLMNQLLE